MYPTNYYIALGSNVGNYINNFSNAIFELKKVGQVIKMANVYKSKPYGYLKQNFFYNSMVHFKSELLPIDLINKIQIIEKKLKKNKRIINGPRKIDLDIIFWGYKMFNNRELSIPHLRASERDFVLFPLQDIAPNFRDPVSKITVKELIKELKNYYIVEKLSYRNLL